KTLAQNKNITLPTDIDPHDKALRDRLSKLSGAQFDHAYMQAMLTDHRKVANEFRHESQIGKDPDIKAFASKTLPTIEEHLALASGDFVVVGIDVDPFAHSLNLRNAPTPPTGASSDGSSMTRIFADVLRACAISSSAARSSADRSGCCSPAPCFMPPIVSGRAVMTSSST